jgi:protein disulfide-isomerase
MNKENPSSNKKAKKKADKFYQWFWLSFLVVSLAYFGYSFYAPSNDIEWNTDITTSQQLANNSEKNTLVFFTGQWCSPCQIMKREVFADQEVESYVNSNLVPLMIDIGNTETIELVKHFQIGATPTTLILDSKGEVINYAVGMLDKKSFLEMIKNAE